MKQPPRALFTALVTLGIGASLLYWWLRFFSPYLESSLVGGLSYVMGVGGIFGLVPYWFPRHRRLPERLFRWNAFIALVGLASSLLWHILAASVENQRLSSLFAGIGTTSILWQMALHSVLAAYIILIRPTKLKLFLLYLYYAIAVLLLLLLSFGATGIADILIILLWGWTLPLIYQSQDAIITGARNTGQIFFLMVLPAAFFLTLEVFPRLFGRDLTNLGIYAHRVAISLTIFYAGLFLVPFLVRLGHKAQRSQQLLILLTTFLEKQQKQESRQDILATTRQTLKELPPVQEVYMRLRSATRVNAAYPRFVEILYQHLRSMAPGQTYLRTLSNLSHLAKGLPEVGAILTQRPVATLFAAAPTDALQVIVVGNQEDCFEPADVQLIATLIDQTALFMEALDRRLYQEERLLSRKEIDFLKETREALLPPVPPILQKVQYHVIFQQHDKTIGGDYYQIEEVAPEKVLDFWLSDCAGSGIAAAYQMAQTRAALNTLWQEKLSPEEFILRLNDALRRVFHKNNFIAATYLRLDLEARTYTLYRPGNPEILYWNPQKQKVELLRPAGVVLGNASSTLVKRILEQSTGPLLPGATWLLFSDGFTEASNLEGEQFGLERLLSLFQAHIEHSPQEIARTILKAVQDFIGDTDFGDDGTLIVIRYQP